MGYKKFYAIMIVLLLAISFLSCSQQSARTFENDAPLVFQDIEGKSLAEYIRKYKIPENANSYLEENELTLDHLKEQLAMDKNLVLFDGVLGGEPFIVLESVKLVDPQWIYCTAEDGHISGALLIKFHIENEKIVFKVYARDVNDEGVEISKE